MSGDETLWLTYKQAADKLGVSPQAVRQKAIRGRWLRTRSNSGQALIQVPEQAYAVSGHRVRTPSDQALTDALKAHVETLKAQLAAAESRLGDAAVDLATERARTSAAISAFAALAERLDQLAAERTRPWWRRLASQ
jgi:hypothetical protein